MWERQSQQLGAQQGAEGLLGRMQAKGIVGNYTGLEQASNALIQRDIFIKKQGCWTGTKRETSADPFLQLPRIRPYREILSSALRRLLKETVSVHGKKGADNEEEKESNKDAAGWKSACFSLRFHCNCTFLSTVTSHVFLTRSF